MSHAEALITGLRAQASSLEIEIRHLRAIIEGQAKEISELEAAARGRPYYWGSNDKTPKPVTQEQYDDLLRRAEGVPPECVGDGNKYAVLVTAPDGVRRYEAAADTYWEALAAVAPGNDCLKVEVIIT